MLGIVIGIEPGAASAEWRLCNGNVETTVWVIGNWISLPQDKASLPAVVAGKGTVVFSLFDYEDTIVSEEERQCR